MYIWRYKEERLVEYEIVKIKELSGYRASVYSIIMEGDINTVFESFVNKYHHQYKSEIDEILLKLLNIGSKYGAREQWFKLREGQLGDLVMAFYDHPIRKLRVYGIRYGSSLLILGSGGPKSKTIRALQEDDNLKNANEMMRKVSDDILKKLRDGDIKFSNEGLDLTGNLKFKENE